MIYLEAALREIWDLPDIRDREEHLATEVAYADDVDFISLFKHKDIEEVKRILEKYNLLVNNNKTKYTDIKREAKTVDEKWRLVKKMGSLIGDDEDVERRKRLSTAAKNKMQVIWIRKDKIK